MSELEPAAHFAADPEAVHDQGDEPAEHPCPACVGGWHGQHCQGDFYTTGQPPEPVECDCVEGACRGEWTEIGVLREIDGVTFPGATAGRGFIAPLGTPPPAVGAGLPPTFQVLESHVDADGTRVIDKVTPYGAPDWSEGPPIGPPIPVRRVEDRENGRYVEVSIGPAHPAYAAVKAGLTGGLSVSPSTPETPADNRPYVRSGPGRDAQAVPRRPVSVASPTVNDDQVRVPANTVQELQEVLAELARPKPPPRPNRATRRAIDKKAGRLGKRRRG